jgi:S-adenosylmethionine:tRNA ribosyltransferase-isomerase
MDIELFDFALPEELIAQSPMEQRDECRLLVVNREKKTIEHKKFHDILDYLHAGDVLVRNNTKVIPARLVGVKEDTQGQSRGAAY